MPCAYSMSVPPMRVGAIHFTSAISNFLHIQRIVAATSRAARNARNCLGDGPRESLSKPTKAAAIDESPFIDTRVGQPYGFAAVVLLLTPGGRVCCGSPTFARRTIARINPTSRSTASMSRSMTASFFCLLGPSGCGKSTLLNILAGFEPATSGSVTFKGSAVTGAGRDRATFFSGCRLGLVSLAVGRGKRALRPARSQGAQGGMGIGHPDLPAHGRSRAASQQISLAAVRRHAAAIANRARARGRAGSPADGRAVRRADALTRRRMHSVLLTIWQRTGKTVVFVTHDIAEAILLADRIAMMSVGALRHRQDLHRRPAAATRPHPPEGRAAVSRDRGIAGAGRAALGTAHGNAVNDVRMETADQW